MTADNLRRDVRIGVRVLLKEKSFCALAVIVLALGIAGVTTMFGVVNGVMLRGFSFPTADRLVSLNFVDSTTRSFFGVNGVVHSMDFVEMEPHQQSFEALSAYLNGSTVNISIDGAPQRLTGAYVTERFLDILGERPLMGRNFVASDNTPTAAKVAIIGYGLWQRDFGGAADVVGKPFRLNGKAATVIGVMPRGFAFPTNEEIWIPLFSEFPPKPRNDPSAVNPSVLGLLKPGVSLDQANAEATTFAKRFASAYPDTDKTFNTGQVEPLLHTYTPRPLRGTLWTMLGFCVGVLLIACVNVMNMQFARATLRAKELAVRSSLGASRSRLLVQMLTESLLLAVVGAALGIALAYASIGWLSAAVHALDNPPPSWIRFDVDAPVLGFTVLCTLAAVVLSGLLPAVMASRANAVEVLRDGGRGNTSRAVTIVSRGLVVFQVVVTCVLLVGSLLQLRSITKQQTIDYGYDTAGLLSARMALMEGDYPTDAAKKTFYDRLMSTFASAPEFQSVALTNRFRMVFSGSAPIEVDGRVYREKKDRQPANFEQVSEAFFDVTGQKVLEGRAFNESDRDDRQPIAIVNAAFARKYFGTSSALGHRFRTYTGTDAQAGPWRTVVGVVTTVRMIGPFNQPGIDESGYYVPFFSNPVGPISAGPFVSQFTTILVRPRGGQRADALAPLLQQMVSKTDSNLPLYFVGTPASQIDSFVAQNRIIASMFTIFGAVAMILAAVGIYGVMSFAVNQRRQEFGVRMALGAHTTRILKMVLRQGAWQVGAGLVVGMGLTLGLATAAGSGIQGVLYGVTGRDPISYGSVAALITVVALVATLVPAQRATRVDPMTALRAE
ncbi:MAG TPA: ABC transporter permease [Vicinamibacterales bacterium]|jgi:putative ABC transport system permease protein|nr:ABC transporter permease [Vicinamibacterales bacterium]